MNSRQVATGTLLTASLLLGGAGLADASPGSRPAMDRGVASCERLEHRIEGLQHHLDRLAERRTRVEARLADAQADGHTHRARHLQAELARLDRAEAKLTAVLDEVNEVYGERCASQGT